MRRKFLFLITFILSLFIFASCDKAVDGKDGKSAYEIAVDNGFVGTEKEWLESLKGKDGKDGSNGIGIDNTEIDEEGNVIIRYTDGTSKTISKIMYDNILSALDFYPYSDGTYGVSVGKAIYLEDIIIPSTYDGKKVTRIIERGFGGCTHLKSIILPDTISHIGSYAFNGCERLNKIIIPNEVKEIEEGTFESCYMLSSVVLPNSLEKIGTDAFSCCYSLNTITIPSSVKKIDYTSFNNCIKLVEIYNLSTVSVAPRYDSSYKNNCIINRSLDIKSIVAREGDFIFSYINGKGYLLDYVGYDEDVILPDSFKYDGTDIIEYSLYDYSFIFNNDIKKVKLSNGVVEVGKYAFRNCGSLTDVILANSLYNVAEDAFPENINYVTRDHLRYLGTEDNPYYALVGTQSVGNTVWNCEINENTKLICTHAFYNSYSKIKISKIPEGVIAISDNAFAPYNGSYPFSVEDFLLTNKYKYLGDNAFKGCYAKKLVISDEFTTLNTYGFSFNSLVISTNIKEISSFAEYCDNGKIYYKGNATNKEQIEIDSRVSKMDSFKEATWYYFTNNGSNESSLGNWWYYDTDGVTIIEKYAFFTETSIDNAKNKIDNNYSFVLVLSDLTDTTCRSYFTLLQEKAEYNNFNGTLYFIDTAHFSSSFDFKDELKEKLAINGYYDLDRSGFTIVIYKDGEEIIITSDKYTDSMQQFVTNGNVDYDKLATYIFTEFYS